MSPFKKLEIYKLRKSLTVLWFIGPGPGDYDGEEYKDLQR